MSRVALITEQLRRAVPGGIGTYTHGLLQGLASVASPDLDVQPWRSRLPVQVRTRLWDRGFGRIDADLVHSPSLSFPRTRGRLVVVVHDLAWRDAPDTFPAHGRRWHERAFRRAIDEADHLVVPSAATADRVLATGGAADRVTVIEEGCDHLPAPDTAAAQALVDGPYILTVGTREPRKNLDRLVEAYRRARRGIGNDYQLVVTGPSGWGVGAALDDVVVTGPVDAPVLAGLYANARAFAYVPLVEGFGLPPVEAMHAGTAVVASSAVPSVGNAALTVDPLDVDAIAAAIVTAATDEPARRALIRKGRARARSLTWRATAESHVALWKSLLG